MHRAPGSEVDREVTLRSAFGILRLAGGAVCLAALLHRLFWGLSSATIAGQNFLAYLTIQSNIAFVAVSVAAGLVALRRVEDPGWLTAVRSAVLSWTVTAGIVFAFLIQQGGVRGIRIDVPWSDHVLHFLLPVFALIDWLLAPGRGSAPWRVVLVVVSYPLLWGGITMLRGSLVGWYPYYFLDLRQVSGPLEFLLTSGLALLLFAAVAGGIVLLSRTRRTELEEDEPVGAQPAKGSSASAAA